jgi:hypothetical protein
VLIRAARIAGTSVDASATRSATSERHGDHDERQRWRSRSTHEVGLGFGDERSRTPTGQQPDGGRDERQEEVLNKESRRDQARRAADGLQQSDPPGAFRQTTPDQDGHAGQGEHSEQHGAGKEEGLVGPQEAAESSWATAVHGLRNGGVASTGPPLFGWSPLPKAFTNALTARGDASDSLRFETYDSGSALVAGLRAVASVAQIRLVAREAAERRRDSEADHPEGVTVQRDRLAETQVRRLGKGALD